MSLCEKDHEIVKMLMGNKKKSYVIVMVDNKQNSPIIHITIFPTRPTKLQIALSPV